MFAKAFISVLLFTFLSFPAYSQATPSPADVMQAYQQTVRQVARDVLPVVVEIEVVQRVSRPARNAPSPLEFFFGRPDQRREQEAPPREFEQRGLGSGILVRRDGATVYVLTNDHVIGNADRINVTLTDGRKFEATPVGSDENTDLALLKFETSEEVPIAVLGDSNSTEVGDFVLAVGNPLGFESTVTSGIVSAIGRQGPTRQGVPLLTDFIQTDAAINRGNSGGALVNLQGEVIGINTWIASQTGGSIGLGFAIPVNSAKRTIDQFIATGAVQYGWLGVNMANPPTSPSNSLNESAGGAFVYSVYKDSPAAKAGIKPGDIITSVGTQRVRTGNELLQAVTRLQPGDRTPFEVRRDGTVRRLTVETGVRPSNREATSNANLWPGLSVAEMTSEIRANLDLQGRTGNLIIGQITPGSPAAQAGLRSGDMILQVNNQEVENLRDFYQELNNGGTGDVIFRIRRNDSTLIIGLVRTV